MKPVNTKSLFHMLCITLEKLDREEINVAQASAISKVVGQCSNLLNYELKRAALMTNDEFSSEHRNLESKNFDSLPE
jgi:hypothetical protein|tara:strand:+ start:65 stop:295 length:231 start_codon:yes stop_codon:yes gene_type:complete